MHSKHSVGIGGHISLEDSQGSDQPYEQGFRRELEEEVIIQTPFRERCVGLINDDETPVGEVHLGVVHLLEVETRDVFPREDDIIESGFRPVEDILKDVSGFETWSQICLQAIFAEQAQEQPQG